jgi:lipopolysaccharide export LptBFGC system permease protein LptF
MDTKNLPSKEQLEAMAALSRIDLTQKMFRVVSWAFFVVLAAMLATLFFPKVPATMKLVLGCIDAIVGWSFRTIVKNLYPDTAPK